MLTDLLTLMLILMQKLIGLLTLKPIQKLRLKLTQTQRLIDLLMLTQTQKLIDSLMLKPTQMLMLID